MTHNFFLKYAPLRLKPRNTEDSAPGGVSSNESSLGNNRHVVHSPIFRSTRFGNRATAAIPNSPVVSNKTAEHEESVKDEGDDAISLENINNWLQRQERRNTELQARLNVYVAENNRLKATLEKSQEEVQNLRDSCKTVQESHSTIREVVEKVEARCTEVNESVEKARHVLEQVKQDRDTWLNNLKECQMRHFDKRVMMIHADYQKTISEKDSELTVQKNRLEELTADLINSASKIDALQRELSTLKNEAENVKKEKDQLMEEKLYYETEYRKLDEGLAEMLNERTAGVLHELSKEKERNGCVTNDLKDCQEKLNMAEFQLETIRRELQLVREEQEREPKEKLREEISALTSEIAKLKNNINGYKNNISSIQEDLLVAQATNRRLEEANKSLPMLSKERAALQEKFTSLENESKSLSLMLTEATSQRDQYKSMLDEREKRLSDATNLNVDLEEKVKALAAEINESKAEMSRIENENKELVQKVENAEGNSRKFEEVAGERAHLLEEMTTRVEELETSLASSKKENSSLKKQLLGCQLKLDYANERLKQMEGQGNQRHKNVEEKEDYPEVQIMNSKGPSYAIDENLSPCSISEPIQCETSGYFLSEPFPKPNHRSSVHELPPKTKEHRKHMVPTTPIKERRASLNPLELLEKADAIVAKEKQSHGDESTPRKMLPLPDYDSWQHHQKRQRVEHDAGTSQWEMSVAPSPVIRINRKH